MVTLVDILFIEFLLKRVAYAYALSFNQHYFFGLYSNSPIFGFILRICAYSPYWLDSILKYTSKLNLRNTSNLFSRKSEADNHMYTRSKNPACS